MPTTRNTHRKLPRRFEALVAMAPPQAILDDVQLDNTLELIDRLMSAGQLARGQALYLETLVQLVQAYESRHHAIDSDRPSGIDALRHLMAENGMNASDLARLLDMHPSMGSKLLNGERSLTVPHIKALADRFKVGAEMFL